MDENIEKQNLSQRTRDRNTLTWMSLDFGGLLAPLRELELEHDTLAAPVVFSDMDIVDQQFAIKEYQRNRDFQITQDGLAQDYRIAEMKVSTGRAKLAIQHTTSEHTLAVQYYDAKVKSMLMAVREYAALAEREALLAERAQAGLAIDKEALHLATVEKDQYLEYIARAMVDSEIAKYQVEVAKANVRAAEAGIAAGEAEIKLINAQTEQYMVVAEKATLQADVALILAEVMTKKLATTKLAVGQEEISHGYGYIQSKLDDMVALYDLKILIERIKADTEAQILTQVITLSGAEVQGQQAKVTVAGFEQRVLEADSGATSAALGRMDGAHGKVVAAREAVSDARANNAIRRESGQTNAEAVISSAQTAVYGHMTRNENRSEISSKILREEISKE